MKIGKTIKLIRTLKGLKQKELSEKINVSHNYLSAVENEKKEPSMIFLEKLSNVLGVPMSFFFIENIDWSSMTAEQINLFSKFKEIVLEYQNLRVKEVK
ncbi:MAG: helix-turn-helix domain-containing protein [Candidatus Humimicrobiaceae bacterium]